MSQKIAIIFVFLYEIYFFFAHFYFKCNLQSKELRIIINKTRVNNLLQKIFIKSYK